MDELKAPSGIVEVCGHKITELSNGQVIEWAKSIIGGHYNVGRYAHTTLRILKRDDA